MPRRLKNLVIKEVSSVDRGAGQGVKVLLMKRDDELGKATDFNAAEEADAINRGIWALQSAIQSILQDEDVSDKRGAISESVDQFRDYVARRGVSKAEDDPMPLPTTQAELDKLVADAAAAAVKKALDDQKAANDKAAKDAADAATALKRENAILKMKPTHKAYMEECGMDAEKRAAFADMTDDQRDDYMGKNPLTRKKDDPLVKGLQDENTDLKKRLAALEDKDQAATFEKRATDLGLDKSAGAIMRKAYAGDAAAQTELDALIKRQSDALAEARKAGKIFKEFGTGNGNSAGATAYDQMMAKAKEMVDGLAKSGKPAITIEQAFAKVFTDPANKELADKHKEEEATRQAKAA